MIKQDELYKIRCALNLTQKQMGAVYGMARSTYINYECAYRVLTDKVAYTMTKRLEDYIAANNIEIKL